MLPRNQRCHLPRPPLKLSNPGLTLLGEAEQPGGRGLGAETRLSDRDLSRVS